MPDIPRNAFSQEIEGFLAWLELEKGLSQNTIESYENDLAQRAYFLKEGGGLVFSITDHISSGRRPGKDDLPSSPPYRRMSALRSYTISPEQKRAGQRTSWLSLATLVLAERCLEH